jgi:hypothetical protein
VFDAMRGQCGYMDVYIPEERFVHGELRLAALDGLYE